MTTPRTNAQNQKDIVSLRDYMESRLESIRATMEATDKTLELRLQAMNEFREQIRDERNSYMPRVEHEHIHTLIQEDIRMLREAKATADGKASMGAVYLSYLLGLSGIIFGVINLVISLVEP